MSLWKTIEEIWRHPGKRLATLSVLGLGLMIGAVAAPVYLPKRDIRSELQQLQKQEQFRTAEAFRRSEGK
ncbi:hypothetical protein FDP41_008932 [Naegleria fowleri]|uniref:Uncharacterized protein n=1 Tax=Naegleria fowleri TaxID=5763 RepID=A0A6A5AZ31_NAEFO|nr:uncharacterized protein FDP41_008932 [Naegleria fowleri]KAF0972683.1 hypothetical protein FDP41_008932 [Naegleria fowleri]